VTPPPREREEREEEEAEEGAETLGVMECGWRVVGVARGGSRLLCAQEVGLVPNMKYERLKVKC
jgi:hypothetical protein